MKKSTKLQDTANTLLDAIAKQSQGYNTTSGDLLTLAKSLQIVAEATKEEDSAGLVEALKDFAVKYNLPETDYIDVAPVGSSLERLTEKD